MSDGIKFELTQMPEFKSIGGLLDSVGQLKSSKSEENAKPMQMWYRGHSQATFDLRPTSGRLYEYGNRRLDGFSLEVEQRLLDRFRRRAYSMTGGALNEWEVMFIGRHHGLPTRILDWTASPLVALYFAVSEHLDKDAALWGFARMPDHSQDLPIAKLVKSDAHATNPFHYFAEPEDSGNEGVTTPDAVKVIHPLYNSPRITAQAGVFTFHSNPKKSLDAYTREVFHRKRLDIRILCRWKVPAAEKAELLRSLDDYGINTRVVYPDLDGLAKSLWQSQVLWKGDAAKRRRKARTG